MKHFIIVKFHDSVNVPPLLEPIRDLFHKSLAIEGVSEVKVHISNTDLPNRHDLMIEMQLTPAALKAFDSSELHRAWKSTYGEYIASKVIFDCD